MFRNIGRVNLELINTIGVKSIDYAKSYFCQQREYTIDVNGYTETFSIV